VVVTQKVAAQAVPVIGALGDAAISYAFVEHFPGRRAGPFYRSPARAGLRERPRPQRI
jgi:hypothetical protein